MSAMVLHDGVYYTPDDLIQHKARVAKQAADAKAKAAAEALAESGPLDVEATAKRLGELEEQIDKLTELFNETFSAFVARLEAAETQALAASAEANAAAAGVAAGAASAEAAAAVETAKTKAPATVKTKKAVAS